MNKLNPANLPMPPEFSIKDTLIEIENTNFSTGEVTKEAYMPVAARLSWFIQNNPGNPTPIPEYIGDENGIVRYKATLFSKEGKTLACGFGTEVISNYSENQRHIAYQKAETQAIGRCLRNFGYGIAFKDEGDEDQPIDNIQVNGTLKSLNQIIESDNTTVKAASASNNLNDEVDFENLSDLDKAVAVLSTPYPIKIIVGDEDLKGQPLWKILSSVNKADGNFERVTKQLDWGIGKKLKGIVNEPVNLRYPEFVKFYKYLTETNNQLYAKALSAIKHKAYDKGENQENIEG